MRTNRTKDVMKWITVLAVTAFSVSAQAAIVVQMQVNDAETKLTITTRGTCQNGANPNGCVRAQGAQPINFNLVGDKNCSAGSKWELDYVALGMSQGSVGNLKPPVVPGDFNADPTTGRVTPNSQNANSIQVKNNNTAAYDVWYTVYATCGGSVIDTDPRIENDGSGRR